ncbi:hypothetical protein [uncultured Jatrophihabitans sp.]|uniref:hypothetical protein n=1 Tax=uncultured Jatrophihabitans sp. TaxID=1610747 RepID=UPI0035CC5096
MVANLGIHRGSLYRTFGSKLALLHRAQRNETALVLGRALLARAGLINISIER